MWRDEYEEYLQARDAQGLFGLGNTMSQGHAMLWQGCLWIVTRFTHNPLAMQVLHGLIAAGFAFVLVFKSPFKLWQSGLLLLGYFFLFEYAVISRCYAFGVLFFFLFAHNYYSNQKPTRFSGIVLFLLANTSIYAMILTAVIITWLFFKDILLTKIPLKEKIRKRFPVLVLAGLGILLAYLQIRPGEDNSFPLHLIIWPYEPYRFGTTITQFFSAFVPISKFTTSYFWNTNFLMDKMALVAWWWPLTVFIVVTIPFIRKAPILLLWLGGTLAILCFQYYTGFRYARYFGHFFIWWLLCLWLLAYYYEPKRVFRVIRTGIVFIVLIGQAIGGILMYEADWSQRFSRGKEAAEYLKKEGYSDNYMIGTVDFALSPIAAELDRKIFTMQHMALCSFTKWDKKRRNSTDSSDLITALKSGSANKPMIFIATHPIPQFEYFQDKANKRLPNRTFLFDNYKFTGLAYFKPGIEYYEGYWLFKVVPLTNRVVPPKQRN